MRCSWLCAPSCHQCSGVVGNRSDGGQVQTLAAELAAPVVCSLGVAQFTAPDGVVDLVLGKIGVNQFFHGARLLAEVLKIGHADHHATSNAARPTPMAVAVKMSRSFCFMFCFRVCGAVAPVGLLALNGADEVAVHDLEQNGLGDVEGLASAFSVAN